jgi:hypothetical protein
MNMNLLRIVLAGGLFMGSTVLVEVQSVKTLALLTVSDDRLPPGCALKPAEPNPAAGPPLGVVVIPGDSGQSALTNPWSGSDRRLAAAIRQRVDGTPPQPDGPPLDRRASAAYALKWADDVVEAYRATYRSANESLIDVFAVRFDDQALALPAPPAGAMNVPRGATSRVVLGPIVVLISTGASGTCFQAISDYVRSLR